MFQSSLIKSNVKCITFHTDMVRYDLKDEFDKIIEVVQDSYDLDQHRRFEAVDLALSDQLAKGHFVEFTVNPNVTDFRRLEFGECDLCRFSDELCPNCGLCPDCCHASDCGRHPINPDDRLGEVFVHTVRQAKRLHIIK